MHIYARTNTEIPRFLITGATGNTGFRVVSRLKAENPHAEILCLVRSNIGTEILSELGVKFVICNLEDPKSYIDYVKPNDTFIEIANLRFARVMLPILEEIGVKRAFCITTTAVFSKHHSYSKLYREIEEAMLSSSIKVTILRPSMIYGNEQDHNMHKLLKIIKKLPFYPIFGNGKSLMQPVHVDDLAEGIIQAIGQDAYGQYNLAGPEALSYKSLIDQSFKALGRRGLIIFIPAKPIAIIIGLLEKIPGFPIKKEQVIRLQEDKSFDISTSLANFGYQPRKFEVGITQEVARLREIGDL